MQCVCVCVCVCGRACNVCVCVCVCERACNVCVGGGQRVLSVRVGVLPCHSRRQMSKESAYTHTHTHTHREGAGTGREAQI